MHRPRILLTAATVAAAAIALGGCSSAPAETPGGDTAELLSSVETMYGTVDVPVPADGELTVVALGWSDAEVALALGVAPVGVTDWQGFGEEHKGVGPWATELFGDETPTLLATVGDDLDYETISALEPDLILNTRAAANEDQFTRLSEIAPTVYAPAGTADYGTRWDVQTAQIAAALGLEAEGAALVEEVQSGIEAAAEAHPEFAGRSAVTGTKFGDAYGAYIAGDARWDLVEELGFVQNPAVLELPSQGFYVSVSVENVGALDADVSVLFPIGYTLDELKADQYIASLVSVTEGRAVFLDSEDEVMQAFSAASPLSIPIAVEGIVPLLAAVVPAG